MGFDLYSACIFQLKLLQLQLKIISAKKLVFNFFLIIKIRITEMNR